MAQAVPLIDEKSIAVLPFENLSSDPENEYFSDGMTEEIINALSKISGLKVTARTSSFVFKQQKKDVRHIGNELGVSLVLEGSIRKSGSRVRITAQLIRTDSGFHVWSENFDRELADIFQLQDEISLLIADKIREDFGHINVDDRLVYPQTTNVDAYELYLKGRFYFFSWNLVDIERAITYFDRAITIDPSYDQPYFGASLCYSLLGGWGYLAKEEADRKAEQYLSKGNRLGKTSVGREFAQAVYQFWGQWNYTAAYAHLQAAHLLNPQDPEPLDFMAEINRSTGDFTTALALNAKALEVNPLSVNVHFTRTTLFYYQGKFDEALIILERGLSLDPSFKLLQQIKVLCLIQKSDEGALRSYLDKLNTSHILRRLAPLLYALRHQQTVEDLAVEEAIDELNRLDSPPLYPWEVYLRLYTGQREEAISLLHKKVNDKMGQVVNFKHDPLLAPLSKEPNYLALVKQYFPADSPEVTGKAIAVSTRVEVLNENEVRDFQAALTQQMTEERIYLDSALTLRKLADIIGLHPNKLSWLLNEKLRKNFSSYVNGFRIEAFQEKSLDPANDHLSILGLAYESGFNSKSVFNEFFKKTTGQTPKAWIKAAKKS